MNRNDPPIEFVSYGEAYDVDFEDMRRRVPDAGKIRELTGLVTTRDLDQVLQGTQRLMRPASDRRGTHVGK